MSPTVKSTLPNYILAVDRYLPFCFLCTHHAFCSIVGLDYWELEYLFIEKYTNLTRIYGICYKLSSHLRMF